MVSVLIPDILFNVRDNNLIVIRIYSLDGRFIPWQFSWKISMMIKSLEAVFCYIGYNNLIKVVGATPVESTRSSLYPS